MDDIESIAPEQDDNLSYTMQTQALQVSGAAWMLFPRVLCLVMEPRNGGGADQRVLGLGKIVVTNCDARISNSSVFVLRKETYRSVGLIFHASPTVYLVEK